MSGLLNSTGAVSGVLGTTVGTPSSNAADIGAGVLPVGVTGGSGLTALGTVVSGNISHADIVYPAGHIVQMVNSIYQGSDIGGNHTGFIEAHSSLRCSITPTSPNKLLLWVTGGQPRPPLGALEMNCSWGIHDGSSTLTTDNLAPSSQGFAVIRGPSSADNWAGGDHYGGHSYAFLYTPGSYGSAIIFTPTFKMTSGTSGWFTEGAGNQVVMAYVLEFKL